MDHFILEYRKRVYGFLSHYIKVQPELEDLTQDVMIKLWINRDKFQEVLDVEKYILTTAHNMVMDHFKKLFRNQAYREKVWNTIDSNKNENNLIKEVYRNDLINHLEKVLCDLPKRQQTVYRLNKIEGLSLEEIGKQLNISPYTAKNHLAQALKQLKHKINPDYFLLMTILLGA
ncbi:RNA polymerase sigma factor [Membranihabitans marinus]|uniref:RNA polymerase sigma factor n=1 Tax=Membranihabitans marinus TaxID=1227546 RepID=UPI001F0302A8|nr:sigma-70 family RNA polymerase sigma factor [Membranihabitans marinus]